ncbi:hypothetical protein F4801DRAFT_540839 [Xylaria longipes]|nr:hypothetical protein F4801DRAFT_540839 [Xylaria longipes]
MSIITWCFASLVLVWHGLISCHRVSGRVYADNPGGICWFTLRGAGLTASAGGLKDSIPLDTCSGRVYARVERSTYVWTVRVWCIPGYVRVWGSSDVLVFRLSNTYMLR